MRRERSDRSLPADIVYTTSTNPCTGCTCVSQSRCPCATPTALKKEGGRQPPEDYVRYALSAFRAVNIMQPVPGWTQKRDNKLDTIPYWFLI